MALRKTTKGVYLDVVKDYRWSPEVWGHFATVFGVGMVVGAIAMLYLLGSGKLDEMTKPQPTVTVTDAGPTHYVYRTVKP